MSKGYGKLYSVIGWTLINRLTFALQKALLISVKINHQLLSYYKEL